MKRFLRQPEWTKHAAFCAVVFCVAASAAQAQFTSYGTGFDGTDTVNGAGVITPYTTNATYTAQGTAPLAGQNGWGSNDSAPGTAVTPTPASGYQTNGGTTTVGAFAGYTGNSGVIGGLYRNPGNTTDATSPDVVPSTASGGTVDLFHLVNTAGASQFSFDVDFNITASTSVAAAHDSFAFTLRSTTNTTLVGTPLVTISFVPSTVPANPNVDATFYRAGSGTAVDSTQGITINPTTFYHLKLTVTAGANPSFSALLNSTAPGSPIISLTPTGGVALTRSDVNQFSADWTLADTTTIANGGYTGAGTNALDFDNVAVTVPEPSTIAMLALGLIGTASLLRSRRQQA